MEYRNLGNSGVKVSALCFGAMTFGEADEKSFMHKIGSDEATSHALLDRALAAGINFIDTADVYGQDGLSERVLGAWFKKGDGRREKVVLATKFRFTMGDTANKSGASRYRIVRCVEDSLRRLGTDRIDLYQIHMQDLNTPEEETVRALDDLVTAGKVVYLGASNYAAYRLVDSLWIAKSQHRARFISLQAQYSLIVRDLEREHVPLCRAHGLGILPWSPLAGGFLTSKYRRGEAAPGDSRFAQLKARYARYDNERNWKIVDAVTAVAQEIGATPSQVALAWLLGRECVSSVIFGARSAAQLDDNLGAVNLKLDEAHRRRLDEVSAPSLGHPYDFIADVHQGRW
jgi:aryl-alcohol dehydrogenase-like predicted oxidoreductase